jgi:hypothetical protein
MKLTIIFSCVALSVLSGCSRSYLVSSGASDNRPLLFESEYELSELKEVEVDGKAFFGIPSFSKNNRNNHTSGILFYFNGIQLGKIPRAFPIATFAGLTLSTAGIFRLSGLDRIPSTILAIPIAGMINNLAWSGAAYSGASRTLNHKLVKENPDIDLFFYPKYDIQRKHVYSGSDITGGPSKIELKYLWIQDVNVKARCKGAKLKL